MAKFNLTFKTQPPNPYFTRVITSWTRVTAELGRNALSALGTQSRWKTPLTHSSIHQTFTGNAVCPGQGVRGEKKKKVAVCALKEFAVA